jgi:hypothetical protein
MGFFALAKTYPTILTQHENRRSILFLLKVKTYIHGQQESRRREEA